MSIDNSAHRGCVDPIPIMTASDDSNRCFSAANCLGVSTCVRPDEPRRLLRLTVQQPLSSTQHVVLWSGPLREVWEQGTTFAQSIWKSFNSSSSWCRNSHATIPYFASLDTNPLSDCLGVRRYSAIAVHDLTCSLRYIIMTTLSLCVFNLLPLPLLDGSHFLRTLLEMACNHYSSAMTNDYDLEALELPRERMRSRGTWWNNQLDSIIPKVTIGLFGGCIVLEIMNAIW